ncbi:SulP family inorganic anion transporter [Leptobacterium sp. I13]|uniref:SulP family inorganic anion transporter n=1 Tax=Leptobacterium meishanense TaxID=3128904 RepID=UPI0030EEF401
MKNFFSNIRGDAFGGITAGIVALPLALAFGVSSGLGPSAGLYGAIFISFFAALFGGTPTQISGPTAPMTAVSLLIIAGILGANEGNIEKALPAILTVFLLAGLIQIILGFAGVGKYIRYIPYPVVSGFMTAIGVMILITQILPSLGYYPKEDTSYVNAFKPQAEEVILEKILQEEAGEGLLVLEDFKETIERSGNITEEEIQIEAQTLAKSATSGVVGTLKTLPRALKNISYMELILTIMTIIIIYGFKRITTAVPSTLVALLVVSGVAYFAGLDYRPIEQIPSGFPKINLGIFSNFSFGSVSPYIFTAISLAFLGAIDSLLTSVVADNMTKTKHNPNKELVGQGIGNSIGALFGGIPGAGATIRTVVNIKSGGKTKLSGMIAGVLLLIILLALGPVASQIPAAVLAGILITVGIGVMDYKGLKAIPSMPKDINLKIFKFSSEVLVMLIVLILSVVWDLVSAVGIGLVLSALIFMKKMGDFTADDSRVLKLKEANQKDKLWKDELMFPENLAEEVFIKHLDGPLFFGYTSEFQLLAKQIPNTASHVVLRMDKVPYIDQTGLYALEEVLLDLERREVHVLIIAPQKQPLMMMKRIDIIPDLVSEDRIFDNFDACINYMKDNVPDKY